MSAFNGAGQFIISGPGLPFVTDTVISSTVVNQLDTDLAAGLSNCLCKDGQSTPTANIPMGGMRLTNVGAPVNNGDALIQGGPATVSSLTVTGGSISGRNRIINGDFRIQQYPTPVNTTILAANNQYFLDRWNTSASQNGIMQYGQFTAASQGAAGAPSAYGLFLSTAALYVPTPTDVFSVQQGIEADNVGDLQWGTSYARTVTVSFWVWGAAGTYTFSIQNYVGTRSYVIGYNVAATNTWQRIVLTIPGDTTSGAWTLNGNSCAMWVRFDCGAGANFTTSVSGWQAGVMIHLAGTVQLCDTTGGYMLVTDVQFEIGTGASAFERRQLATELALCQRYFWSVPSGSNEPICVGSVWSGNEAFFVLPLPVSMRAPPTLTATGAVPEVFCASTTFSTGNIFTAQGTTPNAVEFAITVTGSMGLGNCAWLRGFGGSITVWAEL